jgi:hypothetical protein
MLMQRKCAFLCIAIAILIAGCSSPESSLQPVLAAPVPVGPMASQASDEASVSVGWAQHTRASSDVPLSTAARALVDRLTEKTENGVQHQLVDTTGFPQAMPSLVSTEYAPDVSRPPDYNVQPPTRGLTADGTSVSLVEKDWTGLVLVPVDAQYAKAYTSMVRLTAIEAHPLKDGRVRVWTRVRNLASKPAKVGVACYFEMEDKMTSSARFYSLDVPVGGYRDVFFVSSIGTLSRYTVLVRSEK